jgi:hypothetical protein
LLLALMGLVTLLAVLWVSLNPRIRRVEDDLSAAVDVSVSSSEAPVLEPAA